MNPPVLLLLVLNFACIALLTLCFFRRDFRVSAKWWATSLPHSLCPLFLLAAYAIGLRPLAPAGWSVATDLVAVGLSAASIGLMCFTWGTHRIPLAHFHQAGDTPRHLVTHGAYRRIRHPFYSSYLLLYAAASVFFPHWVTAGFLVYMAVTLTLTAAGEERRLSGSEFGDEYRAHIARTGRFLPSLTGKAGR